MASRMAARSTTAGTPVKSCISTRAGRKLISCSTPPLLSTQAATALRSASLTDTPSSLRSRFSSSTFIETGSLPAPFKTGFLGGAKAVVDVGLAADRRVAAGFAGCR
jgi:hypothetical protein